MRVAKRTQRGSRADLALPAWPVGAIFTLSCVVAVAAQLTAPPQPPRIEMLAAKPAPERIAYWTRDAHTLDSFWVEVCRGDDGATLSAGALVYRGCFGDKRLRLPDRELTPAQWRALATEVARADFWRIPATEPELSACRDASAALEVESAAGTRWIDQADVWGAEPIIERLVDWSGVSDPGAFFPID